MNDSDRPADPASDDGFLSHGEGLMSRAQSIVVRDGRLLMVRHRQGNLLWWCLPGGGIEPDESPAEAAVRELREECGVDGVIVSQTSVFMHDGEEHYSFHVDIGDQNPELGCDPQLSGREQILVGIAWMGLDMLAERDRVYLWTAGLLGIPGFLAEIESWPGDPAYPTDACSLLVE